MTALSDSDTLFSSIVESISKREQTCEWNLINVGSCSNAAMWLVLVRPVCAGGKEIKPPHDVALCEEHRKSLMARMTPWSPYRCMGCLGDVDNAAHLIRRIVRL